MHYAILVIGENPEDQLMKFIRIDNHIKYQPGMFDFFVRPSNKIHRWPNLWKLKNTDRRANQAFKREIDFTDKIDLPSAIILHGEWYGESFHTEQQLIDLMVNSSDDDLFSLYDCHA